MEISIANKITNGTNGESIKVLTSLSIFGWNGFWYHHQIEESFFFLFLFVTVEIVI